MFDERLIEDEFSQPEPLVFLVDFILYASCTQILIGQATRVTLLCVEHLLALVKKNVRVFSFDSALLSDRLLHVNIVGILLQTGVKIWIVPSKALGRDLIRVKPVHLLVIKRKPLIRATSLLYEAIVMATLSCPCMHNDAA